MRPVAAEVPNESRLRIWIVLSWIALPTVMFGGYSLLRLALMQWFEQHLGSAAK